MSTLCVSSISLCSAACSTEQLHQGGSWGTGPQTEPSSHSAGVSLGAPPIHIFFWQPQGSTTEEMGTSTERNFLVAAEYFSSMSLSQLSGIISESKSEIFVRFKQLQVCFTQFLINYFKSWYIYIDFPLLSVGICLVSTLCSLLPFGCFKFSFSVLIFYHPVKHLSTAFLSGGSVQINLNFDSDAMQHTVPYCLKNLSI